MSAQASVSGSGWGFSAQFEASYSKLEQGDNTDFYGLVEAGAVLWTTQLKSITGTSLNPNFVTAVDALPTIFNANTQQAFFSFFDQWGTHIINQSTVGGSLNYCVTSNNSSGLTEQAASASMQFEYDALFVDVSGSAEADWNSMASSWFSSRSTNLTTVGGTTSILSGAVTPTSPVWQPDYSSSSIVAEWAATIGQNPAVIGLSLTPISNVLIGYGDKRTDVIKYQTAANQLAIALDVYLNAPIAVINTSTFENLNWFPTLIATSSSMAINELIISPPQSTKIDRLVDLLASDG